MQSEYYSIYVENQLIAQHIPLQFVLIFVKAIYEEFYAEENLTVIIEREVKVEKEEEKNDDK